MKNFRPSLCLTKERQMNASHPYWHEMQGKSAASNLLWVHFVFWTTEDVQILKVAKSTVKLESSGTTKMQKFIFLCFDASVFYQEMINARIVFEAFYCFYDIKLILSVATSQVQFKT